MCTLQMFLFLNSSEKITDPRLEKTGFEILPLSGEKRCRLNRRNWRDEKKIDTDYSKTTMHIGCVYVCHSAVSCSPKG